MANHKMTDTKYKRIANLAVQENGKTALRDYVSLVLNLYETFGAKYADPYDYCLNSKWFYKPDIYMFKDQSSAADVAAVKEICEDDSKRTLSRAILEHDCLSDLKYCHNNGDYFDLYDRSQYIPGVTTIRNKMGSTYTFVDFFKPKTHGDPYGFIEEYRVKYGLTVEQILAGGYNGGGGSSSGGSDDKKIVTPLTVTTAKKGDSGDNVTVIQTMLKALGYMTGKIDGDYGTQTAQAVRMYQTTYGLTASGKFDKETRSRVIADYKKVLGMLIANARNAAYKGTYTVKASSLNLRDMPGTEGTNVIVAMENGATVTSKGYYTKVGNTDWLYVLYKDSNKKSYCGFASMDYLNKII